MQAVKDLGNVIAKSQMFGCETDAQGQVLALHCLVKRCDPLSLVEAYHLMHGKLTLKAEEMLARVVNDGGTYEIIEHSPIAAEIKITYRGRTHRERFAWEDAKLEPFVYAGKPKDIMPTLLAGQYDKLTIATNYATPRRRMQHLWARVVSDTVRVVAPNLLRSRYTPEEMHQVAIEDDKSPASTLMPESEPETIDAVYEVANVSQTAEIKEPERPGQDADLSAAIREITALFKQLGVPTDAQLAAIKRRGGADMGSLALAGALDLLAALRNSAGVQSALPEPEPPKQPKFTDGSPAGVHQIEAIRSLLMQIVQLPGQHEFGDKFREWMTSNGIIALAQLTAAEAHQIEAKLAQRNLEGFFDASLKGYKPTPEQEGGENQ